jgi:hypothetical protein
MPATPIAVPSCCIVFSVPDAEPISRNCRPDIAKLQTGEMSNPIPVPAMNNGIARSQLEMSVPSASSNSTVKMNPIAATTVPK